MKNNENLHKAKKAKNDEFYTRYEDIEKEICHYDLRGKKIYCNCDDYRWSNFVKYFHDNFEVLGISEICATGYDLGQGAYLYRFDGKDATVSKLEGNGDFRSEECVELLKQSDVVVSNPPFSLFREYVAQIMEYGKKFLIIGNNNAVTYKEIFPYIKENKIWIGCKSMSGSMWYMCPNDYKDKNSKLINGVWLTPIATCWFTNINHPKRSYPLDLYKHYSNESYPKYDNYDAINVDRVADIPMDYDGVIGVPITFLDKYYPEQFEIVSFRKGEDGKDLIFSREREREFNHTFASLFDSDCGNAEKLRRKNKWEDYICKNNNTKDRITEPIDLFFPNSMPIGGLMNYPKDTTIAGKSKYARILIRRK